MLNMLRKETRAQTLIRWTRAMLDETSENDGTFTLRLIETFDRMVPATRRTFSFRDTGQLDRDLKANTQRVRRWIDNRSVQSDGRPCIELEEAWVEALLDPYRSECKADLVRRYGFLPVPMPKVGAGEDAQSLTRYIRECADPIPLIAQMLEDGKFCPDDTALAIKAKQQLREAIAASMQLIAQIDLKVNGERDGE